MVPQPRHMQNKYTKVAGSAVVKYTVEEQQLCTDQNYLEAN